MVDEMTGYTVDVTREDGQWLADVPGLPGAHTFAGNLVTLDKYVREVIVLVEDLPEEESATIALDYRYHDVPDVVMQAAALGRRRRAIEQEATQVLATVTDTAQALSAAGYSIRDAAGLLGISTSRAAQLVAA